MLAFPSTTVQGFPSGLRFYKVEAKSDFAHPFPDGILRLQHEQKIGLRETLADAVDRTVKTEGYFDKEKHVVLEITFTPMGVAYYTKTCQGLDYKFQPMLVKQSYRDGQDWKAWHFHGDLPLQASDLEGNVLITTRLMEVS